MTMMELTHANFEKAKVLLEERQRLYDIERQEHFEKQKTCTHSYDFFNYASCNSPQDIGLVCKHCELVHSISIQLYEVMQPEHAKTL